MKFILSLLIFVMMITTNISFAEEFYPKGPWLKDISGEYFICKSNEGKEYKLNPNHINYVKVITNDKGPFEEDVFYKLESSDLSCYLAQGEDRDKTFLKYIQGLKDLNIRAFIEAMGSTSNKVFIVWERKNL